MKGRRLLALSTLAIILGCEGSQQPTGPTVPIDPSKIISDGAHGGNPNFFFLPPLVPNPVNDPNFERGKANNALQPSLTVEICELRSEYLDAQGLPTGATRCINGDPLKKFPAGTVRQVGLPQSQTGWWTVHSPPADGFYYVLWDTQQSNLDLTKFYRIKVLVDIGSSSALLGVADVDPMSSMREWRHTRSGQVIQVIDDRLLPIPFRVENGGLCYGVTNCTEAVVTNDNPTGDFQIVRVEGGAGPIAGALFPDGWLPAAGPQSVVVTISQVNTGATNPDGTQAIPCHQGLPLQQFNGCFNFATFPKLQPISVSVPGQQFELPGVTTAVCFTLVDTRDPREPFVQLWSSGPSEPAHPLVSVNDALILTSPNSRNCNTVPPPVITQNSANALTRVASAGWQKLKGGLGLVFGVQTAYAVDLGLGGLTFGFSNIGPALTAEIQPFTSTALTLAPGSTTTSTVKIVGTRAHNGGTLTTGIGGLPVTFTAAAGNGTLRLVGSEAAPTTGVTVITDIGGFASVNWTLPTAPNTYTLTANGPATGGPVTFTATVVAPLPDFVVSSGTPVVTPSVITTAGGTVTLSPWTITNQGASFVVTGLVDNGFYLSTDAIITASDTYLDGNHNSTELQPAGGFFNWGGPTLTIPALSPGVYYLGILVDRSNTYAESNENNNYVSVPLVVTNTPIIDGVLSAGEWSDAAPYGPFTVNLPGGLSTTATLLLKNTPTQLFGALQFSQDLSGDNYVIAAVRMDGNGNGSWDNGEDGFVVQQRIAGLRSDRFFDEFFSCNVSPCQGQPDNAWGGTNDGVTASTDGSNPTIIEFAKGINTSDSRDAVLTAGQVLRFFMFTNIGVSSPTLVRSDYPATGWASYTVR